MFTSNSTFGLASPLAPPSPSSFAFEKSVGALVSNFMGAVGYDLFAADDLFHSSSNIDFSLLGLEGRSAFVKLETVNPATVPQNESPREDTNDNESTEPPVTDKIVSDKDCLKTRDNSSPLLELKTSIEIKISPANEEPLESSELPVESSVESVQMETPFSILSQVGTPFTNTSYVETPNTNVHVVETPNTDVSLVETPQEDSLFNSEDIKADTFFPVDLSYSNIMTGLNANSNNSMFGDSLFSPNTNALFNFDSNFGSTGSEFLPSNTESLNALSEYSNTTMDNIVGSFFDTLLTTSSVPPFDTNMDDLSSYTSFFDPPQNLDFNENMLMLPFTNDFQVGRTLGSVDEGFGNTGLDIYGIADGSQINQLNDYSNSSAFNPRMPAGYSQYLNGSSLPTSNHNQQFQPMSTPQNPSPHFPHVTMPITQPSLMQQVLPGISVHQHTPISSPLRLHVSNQNIPNQPTTLPKPPILKSHSGVIRKRHPINIKTQHIQPIQFLQHHIPGSIPMNPVDSVPENTLIRQMQQNHPTINVGMPQTPMYSEEPQSLFPCTTGGCGQSFTSYQQLQSHLQSHTIGKAKPFRCEMCPQTFSRSHDLKRHYYIHTQEKPYHCKKCNKGFSRRDALKRHEKSVQEGKKVQCGLKSFDPVTGLPIDEDEDEE
ncbi:hypothetical protein HK096_003757 [Nowakowskiella sp. JEL0078]|nr:hypothetical protein HK096_003757 [Nowakowskiella sp. JEL0078]